MVGPGQFWIPCGPIFPNCLAYSTAVLPKILVPDLKDSYGAAVHVNHSGCLFGFCLSWMVEYGCRNPCVPGMVVLMLVVGQSVMVLFCSRPGTPKRYSFNWVYWAVTMSAWIMAVATVFPGGGCRLLRVDVRILDLPDP